MFPVVFVSRSRGLHGKFTSFWAQKLGSDLTPNGTIIDQINYFLRGFRSKFRCASFGIFGFLFFRKISSKNMLVRDRGKNNEGVLERPGTKWKVLMPISSTLKCQFSGKCQKLSFRCHVRPNRLKICMYDRRPAAVILETPKPPQFQPELSKNRFL